MKDFINQKDLAKKIYEKNKDLNIEDITTIIDLFFIKIKDNLVQGNRIEIRDLGIFTSKENNIQDKLTKLKKKRNTIHFKISKKLFDKIN